MTRTTRFVLLAVCQFLVVLDGAVVFVALPSLAHDLALDAAGRAWVVTAYMVAFGGLLLLGGRLADAWGRRTTLGAGLALFLGASVAAGLADTALAIIVARVVQGCGAALMAPAALSAVTDLYTEEAERHRMLALWGGIGGSAGALGTLIGGLATAVSWQWVFWINVPLGAVVLVGLRAMPGRPPRPGRADPADAAWQLAASGLIVYTLLALPTARPFTALLLVVLSLAAVALAVRHHRASTHPLVPRALAERRDLRHANALNALVGGLLFATFMLLALTLQSRHALSPLAAGLHTAPVSLAMFLGSGRAPAVMARLGPTGALRAGLLVQAPFLLLAAGGSWLWPGSPWPLVVGLSAWSLALGVSVVAAFVACTQGVAPAHRGIASGLVSTSLQLGGAAMIGVVTAVSQWSAGDAQAAPATAGCLVLMAFLAVSAAAVPPRRTTHATDPRAAPTSQGRGAVR